jgi:hypothetical protein
MENAAHPLMDRLRGVRPERLDYLGVERRSSNAGIKDPGVEREAAGAMNQRPNRSARALATEGKAADHGLGSREWERPRPEATGAKSHNPK